MIVVVDEDKGLAGLCMSTEKMQEQVLKGSGMIAAVDYIYFTTVLRWNFRSYTVLPAVKFLHVDRTL